MKKHACRTYFLVVGDFDPKAFCRALGVTPTRTVRRGEPQGERGIPAPADMAEIGYNDRYRVDVNEMIRKTLAELADKTALLDELRRRHALSYYLEIVPEIASGSDEPCPILSLDPDIVEFLYRTGAQHDLDYYVY